MRLVSGLTAFAAVRFEARTDLTQACDAAAEASAILHELAGQSPGAYQQQIAVVPDIEAEILDILTRPDSAH